MALKTGTYANNGSIRVIAWPAPDKDGDGEEVWQARTDEFGREVERVRAKDQWGNALFSYNPPEGFQNRPGYDYTPNYVLLTERGQVFRQSNGEAVVIKPGQALVVDGAGDVLEVLADEYAQHLWAKKHDLTTG